MESIFFRQTKQTWWGEATDEPAREDARPTEDLKLYHEGQTLYTLRIPPWLALVTSLR